MITDPALPVPYGTVLELIEVNCEVGFANQGDDSVTCLGDLNYSYSIEPLCRGKLYYYYSGPGKGPSRYF